MEKNPIIPVVLGETASGKTSVGIELAKLINGEVISVDSRKVYRGLAIGTAWPQGVWKNGTFFVENIPHHLIGHLSPDKPYNAGDFSSDASLLIQDMFSRGKIPILVGGTGFYFKALQQGLPVLPKADEKFRTTMLERAKTEGITTLYKELKNIDPEAAANITSHDKHKIIRALEIHHLTGRSLSSWKNHRRPKNPWKFAVMGLQFTRDLLEKRIVERSQRMVEKGMIEETATVLSQGYSPACPALSSFGYKEAVLVTQGRLPRSDFLPLLIKGTKSYAKRQRTWFRTQVKPAWFLCDETSKKDEISVKMRAFLEKMSV